MANRKYTRGREKAALKKLDQTQSATKTVRALGYPGRWTPRDWRIRVSTINSRHPAGRINMPGYAKPWSTMPVHPGPPTGTAG